MVSSVDTCYQQSITSWLPLSWPGPTLSPLYHPPPTGVTMMTARGRGKKLRTQAKFAWTMWGWGARCCLLSASPRQTQHSWSRCVAHGTCAQPLTVASCPWQQQPIEPLINVTAQHILHFATFCNTKWPCDIVTIQYNNLFYAPSPPWWQVRSDSQWMQDLLWFVFLNSNTWNKAQKLLINPCFFCLRSRPVHKS